MEKPEYFFVKPSTKPFGGIRVKQDTEFETYNEDGTIHQTLKKCILTTECNKETEYAGIKSKEESKLTTEIPEGTILIWGEDTGYIIPQYQMLKAEEIVEIYTNAKELTKPIEEANKKVVESEE